MTFSNNESDQIPGISEIASFQSPSNPSSIFPTRDAYLIPSMEKSLLSVS